MDARPSAMLPINTAHWTVDSFHTLPEPQVTTTRYWLRAEPLALASLHADGRHTVIDVRGEITFYPYNNECILYQHSGEADPPQERLPRDVLPWGPWKFVKPEGEPCVFSQESGWRLAWDLLNGQDAVRCWMDYPSGNHRIEYTHWLEPSTGLMLRWQRREIDPQSGQLFSEAISSDYAYDVAPPDGIFDLPPAGMPLLVRNLDEDDLTGSLPPPERAKIERVIAMSDAAWLTSDVLKFRRAWTFTRTGHLSNLPSQAEWERCVGAMAGLMSQWESTISTIRKSDCVYRRTGPSSAWMLRAPGTLWVKARLRFQWSATGGEGEVDTEYFLLKRWNGFRIVHWEYPGAEISAARSGN